MILNAERRQGTMLKTFYSLVVQIDVRNIYFIQVETFRIDSETVILRGDLHLLSLKIKDGMVSSVMPEFEFECSATEGQAHDLMPQTNSEDWLLAHQRTNVLDRVSKR